MKYILLQMEQQVQNMCHTTQQLFHFLSFYFESIYSLNSFFFFFNILNSESSISELK